MPFYNFEYITPLSRSQKDQLAAAVTQIHTRKFITPSLFVNVRFTDCSNFDDYVGGVQRTSNKVFASVRPGGGRKISDFNDVCFELTEAWNKIVNGGKKGNEKTELRAVFILGVLTTGVEAGFVLPQAGQDREWLKGNVAEFKKLAESGDEDFKDVMRELDSREDFQGLLNGVPNGP